MYFMKNLIPTAHAKNIFEIDVEFFKALNIKTVMADLDNTLDSYLNKTPSKETINLVKRLKDNNINIIIVSNNSEKRVSMYAKILNVNYISRAFKPFPSKINKYIKKNGLKKDEIIFIGDQLLTDIKVANKAKIKSIYVDEITTKNAFITILNKKIESYYKNRLKKHNKFINWEVVYGNLKKS